ncbi:MAG: cysteine desulfurase [Frankiales bacterium]|nr:cysteine desulfurase [Frankiales bacterium]
MLEEVISAMTAAMAEVGNPSSLHSSGRKARRVVEESRERFARALGARPSEVIFTSGGTEADNLAVKGIYLARRAADPRRRRILASSVEHHAVLDAVQWLAAHEGAELELLPVDHHGTVLPETLAAAIARDPADVALVSVMWANNEVGTVQPIPELVAIAHEHGIPFHSDAIQAVACLEVSFADSGLDAMSVTAHKLGGPYGVGALLLRRDAIVDPIVFGGGQERGVRSGTLDVAGIVGFAVAVQDAVGSLAQRQPQLATLRDALIEGVRRVVPDVVLAGDPGQSLVDGGPSRLPGNAHLRFPDCEGDSLLMLLDAQGIECSTGSACTAGVARPSHVLLAMGVPEAEAVGALRFSFGHTSTPADVDAVVAAIGPVVERARRAWQASRRRVVTPRV